MATLIVVLAFFAAIAGLIAYARRDRFSGIPRGARNRGAFTRDYVVRTARRPNPKLPQVLDTFENGAARRG
ncbi:hypothetical protein GCM10023339_46640 [Alloalcanivorax gelatiniphagus]